MTEKDIRILHNGTFWTERYLGNGEKSSVVHILYTFSLVLSDPLNNCPGK